HPSPRRTHLLLRIEGTYMTPPDTPETRERGRFPRRVGDYTLESFLLHLSDPSKDGPIVPDIPASATYRAINSEHLGALFQSLIECDPASDRAIPTGAMSIYQRLGNPVEWMLARAFAMVQGGDTAIVFSDG